MVGAALFLFRTLGNTYMQMWQGMLCILVLAVVLLVLVPYMWLKRRQRAIVAKIPLFIDQVSRALSTGKSVEGAVRGVTEDIQMPLRGY